MQISALAGFEPWTSHLAVQNTTARPPHTTIVDIVTVRRLLIQLYCPTMLHSGPSAFVYHKQLHFVYHLLIAIFITLCKQMNDDIQLFLLFLG